MWPERLRFTGCAGELEQLRLRLRRAGRGEDAGAKRGPAASVHEAERREAVEPGVGDALEEGPGEGGLRKHSKGGDLRGEGVHALGNLAKDRTQKAARCRLLIQCANLGK
jgi:hypothetical protein